jgi:hypothetical protein
LPVPTAVWTDIGLDFVEALPKVRGKSVILTVVDRFSKYCHFIPLAHPYSAESVAQAFFAEIVRLHGMLQSMVSDRDPVFTSTFWKELMRLMGTKLHMTTAFHPQSDGQTEAANRVITMYLRCFTGDRPRQWLRWLPWAEFIYNTANQSSLRDTPFRIVYGREPPTIRSYEPGETRVAAVAKSMAEREEFLRDVRYRLEQAQTVQKRHYDKLHRAVSYKLGDWVLLRLRHRPIASLDAAATGKLKPRYFGHIGSLRSSMTSRFGWSFLHAPASTMCSTSTSSSTGWATRRLHRLHFRSSTTELRCRSLNASSRHAWRAAFARSWCAGRTSLLRLQLGKI